VDREEAQDEVKLIIQPADGATPVVSAIDKAKKTLDIVIFRFDRSDIEKALHAAVKRGVVVRALIAHTNKGGEKNLRKLELRLLDAGATVARTADDLTRYHGKLMIVDREQLHVYGFNYTGRDLASRSFGLVAQDRRTVQEALKLFDADAQREEFEPSLEGFVVSPENAREELATFIKRAHKSLAIWDPKVTDTQMLRLLHQRAKAGVDIRIIGKVGKRGGDLRVQKMPGLRLHVRAIVRDGDSAFVGSQSLRALELDARREVGLITKDQKVVKRILEVFQSDWAQTDIGKKEHKAHDKELALQEVAS
jgi:phosphatidylserine/phosphatidylglycerophosphate/cardiolipin synthase-like enzyme